MKKAFLLSIGLSLCLVNSQEEAVQISDEAPIQSIAQDSGLDVANLRRQDVLDISQQYNVQTWRESDDFQVEPFQPDLSGYAQDTETADYVRQQYQPDWSQVSQEQVAAEASQANQYGLSGEYRQDAYYQNLNEQPVVSVEPTNIEAVQYREFVLPESAVSQASEQSPVLTLLNPQENR